MSSARLTALRLVGFKSFAERTVVEFGPGISAIVGPNGSGKSNLADALRWTLGEQGRMLRTRRSEDVIFAGSSSRRAIGMADVTLVIDNGDRLLPVDYGEVEIGRRLYRSGESEYLLNRQRIRLRDLVELLDAGNLADNAFLFIGQGMVDQALALRPEERRPLFEEAAGVRRHERRRRHAEQELAEAESNLDRLRDVLAELRPQAKRLAAQAEQLQARRTAGVELAEGLLLAARARWINSSKTAAQQHRDVERARASADSALRALKQSEADVASLTQAISRRADVERVEREALERQRSAQTELRVGLARVESELASLQRDAERLAGEREALERRITDHVSVLAEHPPESSVDTDDELAVVERQLADLEAAAGPADSARDQRLRTAELEQSERRRDNVGQALAGAEAKLAELEQRLAAAESERTTAAEELRSAESAISTLEAAVARARAMSEEALAARSAAQERLAESEAELAAARGRLVALEASLAGTDDGLARAARARGAPLLGEGLEIEPTFMAAVSAALGAAATAYLVSDEAVPALTGRRGTLALSGTRPTSRSATGATAAAGSAAVDAAAAAGGGSLAADGLRRDPQTEVTRLLERVVWLPTIEAALQVRRQLPPGWRAVTLAGELVADDGIVTLAGGESALERRAARDAAEEQVKALEPRAVADRASSERARTAAAAAADAMQNVAAEHDQQRREQRRREEAERVAARRAEQLLRETTWERAQVARLQSDLAAAQAVSARLQADLDAIRATIATHDGQETAAQVQARRTTLREQRDRLRRERDERAARLRADEETRRRAEIGRGFDESRLGQLDTETASISGRLESLNARRAQDDRRLATADEGVKGASASLEALLLAGSDERARLTAAERAAADAREKLRAAETASRDAELHSMEARLQLEQTREQLLVELATIGADGMRTLRQAAGREAAADVDAASAAETLEDLLDQVVERWSREPADRALQEAPTQGRLATLRRRFNELGAGNPFAVEEYDELRERLEGLDAQRADMELAITSTRELIASLSALINDQFRSTFAALEDAFQRRFHELFGGGDAQLSLTAPEDLSATGVEIHARPPGKKRQPLSMLSGGERALTAVSLLLAMLEVRPVPFCVLDEVDAALDEANVGRFARALRGLSEQTQFIVITHNRGTIESADALYGVTIDDDAVSRIVSLRLPERELEPADADGGNGHGNGMHPAEGAAEASIA